MMKSFFYTLLACILISFSAVAGDIVFIGDSITKGTDYGGVTIKDTFAYKIATSKGYTPDQIINAGKSGDTSAGIFARLDADVILKRPATCVIMVGINDWSKGISVASYRSNVASIFSRLKASGINVVGITSNLQRGSTSSIGAFLPYLTAFENEAYNAGVPVIDLYREIGTAYLGDPAFSSYYVDNVHLTKSGHDFVVKVASQKKYSGIRF